MPKQVDHDARRLQIAKAAFDLISERGLEAATLRDVALRAEVSLGAVQRCFSTKDEMIVFVLEYMNQRVTERIQGRISATADPDSAVIMLEQTLIGIIPVDRPSLAESRVWLAFIAQAAVNPKLAAIQREQYTGTAELFALLLKVGRDTGKLRADLEPADEAESLLTFADGLNIQILVGRLSPEDALAALRRRLDDLHNP